MDEGGCRAGLSSNALMQPHYTPHGRTERLVAAGRVVLAGSSLLAIWLDPAQPERYATATYGLMAVYVVYSVALAGLVWSTRVPRVLYPLVTHLIDLAAFSVFIFLTEGPPTSPFFVYFIFSILCATLRWGWRATLWTSLFSLTVFLGMGLVGGRVLDDERLNRFIIRSVYLSVVATMLGYLGAYEQQLRGEMARLARWPLRSPRDARDVLNEALDYAASVMNAPRVLLVWEESEEPWVHRACRSAPASALAWEREAPGRLEPIVAAAVADRAFFSLDAAATPAAVLGLSPRGELQSWQGAPIHARLQGEYAVRAVLGAPLKGEVLRGWLFFLDLPRMTTDDMVIGEIVAQQVTARLEHFYLLQKLQQSAVMEERGRLARDLHDGVLQSLAGTALQLHALRHSLGDQPREVVDRLGELQSLIVAEHRQLRSFIRELRPAPLVPSAGEGTLAATLGNLVNRVERHWGLRVELAVGDLDPGEADRLGYDISHIVHEALVNAARHGGGSAARVEVGARAGCITILVADNGHGFGFEGRYDLPELTRTNLGPATLKERVASLGGAFVLESRTSGARLEITLPAPSATA
jgi:signal transduction histidine kinase